MDNRTAAPTSTPNRADGSWIEDLIREFCTTSANTIHMGNERAWTAPLVAFADGDDPLFIEIREHIGDFYWTPREAFQRAFPGTEPENLTVVCWVLPQTPETKRDNRQETHYPAERWVRSRRYGGRFNDALHEHVVQSLSGRGVAAVAPTTLSEWGLRTSESVGLATPWSHRHAAHVAGLGTFGLSDGLITPVGKAMRCGSVVIQARIPATPRPYDNAHAYCLHYAKGTCGKCITRCPADAITHAGHDKDICKEYVFKVTSQYGKDTFGVHAYGCGLCQVGVPCESSIPLPLRPDGGQDPQAE